MSKFSLKAGGASGASATEKAQKIGFMEKLVKILNESDERIVSWSSSGTSFLVHDLKRFSEEVLQQYLRTTNFASFIRQLNYYGFHKVTHPAQNHVPLYEFRHEKFQRDNMDGVSEIRRRNGATDGVTVTEHEALRSSHEDLQCRLDCSERVVASLRAERDMLAAQLADSATQLSNALAALSLAQAQAKVAEAQLSSGARGGDVDPAPAGRKRQRQRQGTSPAPGPAPVPAPAPSIAPQAAAPQPLLPLPLPLPESCGRRDSMEEGGDDCWGLGEADPLQWGDFSLNPSGCPVSPFAATAGGGAGGLAVSGGDAMDDAESALLPLRVSVPLPVGCDLEALRPFSSLALEDGSGAAPRGASLLPNPVDGGARAPGASDKVGPGSGPGMSGSPSMLSLAGSDLADLDEVDLGGSASLLDWGSWMDQTGSLTPLTPLPPSPVASGTSGVDCSGVVAPRTSGPSASGASGAGVAGVAGVAGGGSASTAASQVPDERLQRRMQDMSPEERVLLLTKIAVAMITRTMVVASGFPGSAEAAQVAAASAAAGCATPVLGTATPVVAPTLPPSPASIPTHSTAPSGPVNSSSSSSLPLPAASGSASLATAPGAAAPRPAAPAVAPQPSSRGAQQGVAGDRATSPPRAALGGGGPSSPTPATSPLRMRTGGACAGPGAAAAASDLLLESQFPPEVLLAYMLPARDVQLMYDARMGGAAARMVTVN